jgi:hypothetical protein
LPHGAEVGFPSALGEAGELKILKHPLAENRRHVLVLSQKVKKEPLRHPICENPANGRRPAVPRDREIPNPTAWAICRQLAIPDP